MQPQVKSFQAYSNGLFTPLLEICGEGQWSPCYAWSYHSDSQLRTIRMDFTTVLLILYQLQNNSRRKKMTPEAEKFNGWAAMLGFVAAVGAYATTGNIIPGIF